MMKSISLSYLRSHRICLSDLYHLLTPQRKAVFLTAIVMGLLAHGKVLINDLYYHDNDSWPAHAPTALWFNYGVLDQFLKEWTIRKNELAAGEITKDEYFEWKINWPQTCDDCGKHKPKKEWRKQTELLQQVP